jgi:tetrapyrrole methylase family protein/MazG family protein
VDPVASGARIVDGESFAAEAAGERGPLLVAQCWSPAVLSAVKLSAEVPSGTTVVLLHHLGLEDERIEVVGWDDLDRTLEPDHLTSLWIPTMAEPVGSELVRLDELMHDLRQRCPWDRRQTHGSLARHLMEESYEVLEAIDALSAVDAGTVDDDAAAEERAVAHLEEELGDLLFQVYFHATLAAEEGRFSLADVARGVHDKLVSRHPHLFAGAEAGEPDRMAADWESLKMAEKNRTSITEGIPAALPALALAAKLQRKGLAVGMHLDGPEEEARSVAAAVAPLGRAAEVAGAQDAGSRGPGDDAAAGADEAAQIGALLFSVVSLARALDVDPESALRARAAAFRRDVEALG